jgi:hypothetical protein
MAYICISIVILLIVLYYVIARRCKCCNKTSLYFNEIKQVNTDRICRTYWNWDRVDGTAQKRQIFYLDVIYACPYCDTEITECTRRQSKPEPYKNEIAVTVCKDCHGTGKVSKKTIHVAVAAKVLAVGEMWGKQEALETLEKESTKKVTCNTCNKRGWIKQ